MADILHPVRLGHSNIQVSPLCLGGMSFGKPSPKFHQWTIGPKETEEVIGYAFDRGINFIDTANGYAFGTSEEYIGKAIKNLHIPREQLVLASKVYFNEGRLSRKAIIREIEGTLHRLETDYLDFLLSIVSITTRLSKKLLKRLTRWSKQVKCVRLVQAKCMLINCITCKFALNKMDGPNLPACNAITIYSTEKMNEK